MLLYRNYSVRIFQECVHKGLSIQEAVEKTQQHLNDLVDEQYKGQRLKGFVKLDYDQHVVSLILNKFSGGNAQFSAGIGTKRMVCPDPFMGRLADPNMNR